MPLASGLAARVEGGRRLEDDDAAADGPPPPRYLLPPIHVLLLRPLWSDNNDDTLLPPAVLHGALLGLAIPPTDAVVELSGPLLPPPNDDDGAPLRYACQVRRLAPMAADAGEEEEEEEGNDGDDSPLLKAWMRRVRAWGGGVVTRGTRLVVEGQTCRVVAPTREAWAKEAAGAAAVGMEKLDDEDVVYDGLLAQLCLPLKLATSSSSSSGGRSGRGCHAVLVEGSAGSGKTSLVGAAARRLGLPTVLVRPGDLLARHDVEADAALATAAEAVVALAPSVLFVDSADLLFAGGRGRGGGGGRAGRLLAASRGEVDAALGRWLAGALEKGAGPGVALVLAVREGWRPSSDAGDAPRIRMSGAAVGPAAAAAVLRSELEGDEAAAASVIEEAACRCQGFTLGEVAAVARRAKSLAASGGDKAAAAAPPWPAAVEAALAEARTRRLAAGTGLPPLGRVDPPVAWADVGGLRAAKAAVREMVSWPMAHAAAFRRLGIAPPTGLLLYGPPGTGKTLVAKAAACQTGAAFLSLRISDMVRGEVGTAEIALRDAFRAALRSRPALIFIDEFQALFTARDSGGGSGGRLASQLLQSMDELRTAVVGGDGDAQGYVSVLAATNAPEAIDPAFLRPGRFDSLVYAPLPDLEDRREILEGLRRRMPSWAPELDPRALAERTEGFSGADLANLLRRAALQALAEATTTTPAAGGGGGGGGDGDGDGDHGQEGRLPLPLVTERHVNAALAATRPSTSAAQLERYRAFGRRHGGHFVTAGMG